MQNMNMMGGAPGQKMPGQQPDFNKLFITERGLIHKALIYIFMLYRKHRTHQTQVRYGE